MKFTAIDATLLAFSLSDNLPSGFERVRTNTSCVERHLCTVNSAIDHVEVGGTKTEATRVNLVKVAEYFELELSRECRERISMAARWNERQTSLQIRGHLKFPFFFLRRRSQVRVGARQGVIVSMAAA